MLGASASSGTGSGEASSLQSVFSSMYRRFLSALCCGASRIVAFRMNICMLTTVRTRHENGLLQEITLESGWIEFLLDSCQNGAELKSRSARPYN